MKTKILAFILYGLNALTVQYLVSFARSDKTDYIKLLAIAFIMLVAGYIVNHFERKVSPNAIFFLILALGLPLLAAVPNKWFIQWCIEFFIGVLAFFVGFQIESQKGVKKFCFYLALSYQFM
jgi:hypothetical protein